MSSSTLPCEMLDLVDENDQVIGVISRDEAYKQGLSNFRVIKAFILNDQGQLFIPRRQKHKRLFPLHLDASVGGHVSSGESYDEALAKEAKEELNIDIDRYVYAVTGNMNPHTDGVRGFARIYTIHSNETPEYNTHDIIEHYWLTPEELVERLLYKESPEGDLIKVIRKFYLPS